MSNKFITTLTDWAIDNSTKILTTGTIGFSLAAIALTAKNSNDIIGVIEETKALIAQTDDPAERKEIYAQAIKEISVKALPIVICESMSIYCVIKNNRMQEQKLLEATNALALAQTAITSYRQFELEAQKKLGEEETAELRKEIAQKRIDAEPPTKENDISRPAPAQNQNPEDHDVAVVNSDYFYHDIWAHRYFHSRKSPNDIKALAIDLSDKLMNGAIDGDYLTLNDLYRDIADPGMDLTVGGGNHYGFSAEYANREHPSQAVDIYISPGEYHGELCWELDILAQPFSAVRP